MTNQRLENMLGALATSLADLVRMRADSAAGHSGAAASALTYLAQEPGTGINQLMDPLGLTQSATVRLVDRLAADGLVRRQAGGNGRSVAVYLTGQGEKVTSGILAARRQVIAASLAGLADDEMARLAGLVEKMLSAITKGRADSERMCRMCDLAACPVASCPVTIACERIEDERAGDEHPFSRGLASDPEVAR